MQHLREVAIDHTNGVFAGTNNFVATIGGRPPLSVEAFVDKHRDAFRSTGRPDHWGLPGMRERARKIRAGFEVWSRPGAGTEIELRVPARIAYSRNGRRWTWWLGPLRLEH